MEESRARTIDALCKIATALALVIGGGLTAFSYITNREAQTRSAAIEAKQPFLQRQLGAYVDVSSTLAILVASKDPSELAKAKEHFWNLYWGQLRVVEEPGVGESMDRIAKCLDQNPQCPAIENLVTDLTNECRHSLETNWEIGLAGVPANVTVKIS